MGYNLLDLPNEILDNILSYFSYDEISRIRLVCKGLDAACQRALNKGFVKAERNHAACLRRVKARLPRRESERKHHPLARHCDILTAMETRLSLLAMTFMKYVDMNLCCFIPGKVIDEINRLLRVVQQSDTLPRAHEILQELRDISSMAMEHFDEHIVPRLKNKLNLSSSAGNGHNITSNGTLCLPSSHDITIRGRNLEREISKVHLNLRLINANNQTLKKEVDSLKTKLKNEVRKSQEQEKQISDLGARLAEQEGKMAELSRKLLESDRRFQEYTMSAPAEGPFLQKRGLSPEPENEPTSKHFKAEEG